MNGRSVSWRSERHFDLLKTLIEAEPEIVSYEVLRNGVWRGKQIEPHTIAQTVKNLRERLGVYQDCIRNQPGKGYHFDRPRSASGHLELEIATMLEVAIVEWTRRTGVSLLRALRLFRQVVELDPSCAQAHLGVAACITMGCHVGFAVLPMTELSEARSSAEAALSLAEENRTKAAALCQVASSASCMTGISKRRRICSARR